MEHDHDHDHGHATEPDANDVNGYADRDSTTLRQLDIGDLLFASKLTQWTDPQASHFSAEGFHAIAGL